MTNSSNRTTGEALVHTAVLVGTGYLIGRCIRDLSVRGRWLLLGIVGAAIGWFASIDSDPYSESGETTPLTWMFALCGLVLIGALVQDTRQHVNALRAQQYAVQQQYAAQYAAQQRQQAAAARRPAAQRTERTVTVVRAPAAPQQPKSNVSTYQPSDVRRAITERSQARRPVRHREQHGNLTINDRRAFDPELGE